MKERWSERRDSNPRHSRWQRDADSKSSKCREVGKYGLKSHSATGAGGAILTPRSNGRFKRVRSNIFRHSKSRRLYAVFRSGGKVVWRALKTDDLNVARQRLPAEMLKAKSPSIQAGQSLSLRELLKTYEGRLGILAARTIANHKAIMAVFLSTWPHPKDAKVETISTAMLEQWLASHKKRLSGVGLNDYLTKFLRPLFRLAVEMNALESSPADGLKKIRVETPIRLTPTLQTALRIIEDVRLQKMNARSQHSADVLELMLKTGCGQGEVAGLRGEHIDLGAGRIWFRRAKTARSYCVPVFPWLKPLIRTMQTSGRIKPGKRVFGIVNPRKALLNSCRRLGLPCYTPRAFRRAFVTECIQRSIDFKVIAGWVGHSPSTGGRLVAEVYGQWTDQHSQAMAERLL